MHSNFKLSAMATALSLLIYCATQTAASADDLQETETAAVAEKPAKIIPTAVFANENYISRPKLSPDGSKLVYRKTIDGKNWLSVFYFDARETRNIPIPEFAELSWYRWAGDERVLFSVSIQATYKYSRQEVEYNTLFAANVNSKEYHYVGLGNITHYGDKFISIDPNGQYLLMPSNGSSNYSASVHRVNIDTNKSEEVIKPQNKIQRWIADNTGVVRMGISTSGGGGSKTIYYRKNADEKFTKIATLKVKEEIYNKESLLDAANIISGSDEGYILSSEKTGRFALYKYNYLTRETGEMIFGHDQYDVSGYNLTVDGSGVESVQYTDDRDRVKWLDPEMAKQQKLLDAALPGQEVWVASKSVDNKRMIILATSATDPGSFYLYDPAASKMDRFGGINDAIPVEDLATTKYIGYTARDGTKINGYLTLPKGRTPKNLPLIIMPHGGPFGVRDTLDYSSDVQFLANRGYAVLQPNFRGSGGYGDAFYDKGEGTIGRAMQDDLDDGMDWLAKKGTIDPKRVCLVGSSYGGYAALWGVTRNPERYRCAASFAGVTDWDKQIYYDRNFFSNRYSRNDWKERIKGDKDFDLDDVSPVRMVDSLQRPVLLVHGEKDTIVPFSQYTLYKSKLEGRDKQAEFLAFETEGHGISEPENIKKWLGTLEAFLKKHNPPD